MNPSILTAKPLILAGTLIFTMTSVGLVHAGERDMPDEIAPADSAVRDTDAKNQDKSIKERLHIKNKTSTSTSTSTKRDNSRYSTDGIERYEEDERDKGYGGTGPKREGRY